MNRRTWIKKSATVAAGLGLAEVLEAAPTTPLVDCHTHFYDPTRPQGVPWPPKGSPLYRAVLPADWRAAAAARGVTKTVVVEASPWLEDNQWILDLAAREPDIVGFIGNLDFTDAAFPKHLARFAANPLFRGLRGSAKSAIDDLVRGGRALAERDLALDLNGGVGFVATAAALAKEVPELRIVIDHVGAAGDPRKLTSAWKSETKRAAECANVFMKVSGMVEQTAAPPGEAPREPEVYRPVLDHLWESFGKDRLIFGSNWPVSEKGAGYDVLFRIVREFFDGKGASAAEKFFRGNSLAAYRWIAR
jgi:predicted TIM-barrel fold metal-dependent hydrolase